MVKKALKVSITHAVLLERSQWRGREKKETTARESKASQKKQKEVNESQDEVKSNSDPAAGEQEEAFSSSMYMKERIKIAMLLQSYLVMIPSVT